MAAKFMNKNKECYFNSILKVDRYTDLSNNHVQLIAHENNGRKTIVEFSMGCHAEQVSVYSVRVDGVKVKLSPYNNGGRLSVNRNNSSVSINELIHQFWRMSYGFPVQHGEYNHNFPACWAGIAGEIFSPTSGQICSHEQNVAHWNCLLRIYKETGYKCSMDAYSRGCTILSNHSITREIVMEYEQYELITIIEDDGDPKEVC